MQSEHPSRDPLPPFPWFYTGTRKLTASNWLYFLAVLGIGGIYSYIKKPEVFLAIYQNLSDPIMLGVIVVFAIIIPSLAFFFFKPAKLTIFADHMEYEKGNYRFSSVWKDMKDIVIYSGGRNRDPELPIFRIKTLQGKTRLIDSVDWSEITENPSIAPGYVLINHLGGLSGIKARLEGEFNGINYGIYALILLFIIVTISMLLIVR